MELILLALAAYAAGLGMGAVAANLWSLRADAFRVNARERKHQDNR
ncbi:MAG: hypothetical protein GW855_12090 [Erythrobacter sp.]|nr:hypothetical protein [Erythrobacter sp.]